MVQKLSDFLGTSFSENPVDSAGIVTIIGETNILLDSGTTGNYIKSLTAGNGFNLPAAAHALDATLTVDSSFILTVSGTQTISNKTINLSNNTLVTTLGQLSAAVSGDNLVGETAGQTLSNKTLTSPTITQPTITGPGSVTNITTFGLRDVTTTDFQTRIRSNNTGDSADILTADRTLTLAIGDNDRTLKMLGNVTFGNAFTTNDSFAITLDATGTTSVTLPTSGTLISKDDSGSFTIVGTMTGEIDRSAKTSVVAGTYGDSSNLPIITVDSNGFVDLITTTTINANTLDNQDGAYYRIDVYDASGSLLN